ncbi:hypothetical protein L195_g012992, partial [Trifolium pratense]
MNKTPWELNGNSVKEYMR